MKEMVSEAVAEDRWRGRLRFRRMDLSGSRLVHGIARSPALGADECTAFPDPEPVASRVDYVPGGKTMPDIFGQSIDILRQRM
jgi:hypothetical protein